MSLPTHAHVRQHLALAACVHCPRDASLATLAYAMDEMLDVLVEG